MFSGISKYVSKGSTGYFPSCSTAPVARCCSGLGDVPGALLDGLLFLRLRGELEFGGTRTQPIGQRPGIALNVLETQGQVSGFHSILCEEAAECGVSGRSPPEQPHSTPVPCPLH